MQPLVAGAGEVVYEGTPVRGLEMPGGIEAAGGRVYISEWNTGAVAILSKIGNRLGTIRDLDSARDLLVDDGVLYVADPADDLIARYDTSTDATHASSVDRYHGGHLVSDSPRHR